MKHGGRLIIISLLVISLLIPLNLALAQEQGVTVIDDFGRKVTIPHKPMKIVSLAPSNTEILFALGLGDRVVGVTSYCNYPPEVLEKVGRGEITVIGGYVNPSLEKITALEPDLVLGHDLLSPDFVAKLEELKIPIVLVNTSRSIDHVFADIMLVGKACWAEDEASKLVNKLRSFINFWEDKVKDAEKVSVAEVAWVNPIFIAGNGTYIGDIIEHAGGRNVFSDKQRWASISDEEFVKRNPEHIIVPYRHGQELIYQGILNLKEKGLISGEIHPIDPDIISRPGPRIAILFEEVIKVLHPEVWEKVVEIRNLIAPSRAVVGDLLTIYVVARNPGLVGGEKIVELEVAGKTLTKKVVLRPEESKLLNFTFVAEKKGEYLVKAGGFSKMIKASPTSEEVMSEAKETFEKSLKQYLANALSPMESKIGKLTGDFNSLNERVANINTGLMNLNSRFSGEIMRLQGELDSIKNMAMASMIVAIIAIVTAIASIAYAATRARGAKAE